MTEPSVLIIDDEIIWHKLARRLLAGAGYKIYTAATCAAGIELAALYMPDCIILDFHLPDGDAVAVCASLKAIRDAKKIHIIIFSSDPEVKTIAHERCLADDFILKGRNTLMELPAALKRAFQAGSDE